ncbi:MAG: formate dehydrogenase accessory sulfurtransferase FdhD [Methanomicrobiales archaeon]|nr:formate dehydrogenase accessory sulfurtransferase FdhD [Methanomicrobiales archaeon]
MTTCPYRALQVRKDGVHRIEDTVCREETFALRVNGELVTRMVASPDQLRELGAGFVVSEGIADRVGEVEVRGYEIQVTAPGARRREAIIGTSCGVSLAGPTGRVHSALTLSPADVFQVAGEIETEEWRATGGLHCSVLFTDGRLVARSGDVGRHNTVDKVIGRALLQGIDLSRCILGCTGRQPAGMVAKAARAGIPVIISRAASTDRGIAAAEEAGITLICFTRGERFTVYTHPERIPGIS